MRVYVAARWARRAEAARVAELLIEQGHEVTSTWILPGVSEARPSKRENAVMDLGEVMAADFVILLAEPEGAANVGGNRYFECGAAVAWDKQLVVVGERELVFFHLPQVEVVAGVAEMLDYMSQFD